MYLYEEKNNNFQVYELKEKNASKTMEYRISELMKQRKKIIFLMDLGKSFTKTDIEKQYNPNEALILNNQWDMFNILYGYYSGYFKNCKTIKVVMQDNICHYFLLHEKQYNEEQDTYLYDVIEINKALYLLSLIEQKRFNELEDENIDEQLDLFSFEKIPMVKDNSSEDSIILKILKNKYNKNV